MKKVIILPLILLAAMGCGKKSSRGQMAGSPPGAPQQDFSNLAYNPTTAGQSILMSDYMFLNTVTGDKNKRIYGQASLFFIKAKASDKTKIHQYQLFYREFVTCQDGPTPYNDNPNISRLTLYPGEAKLQKGGILNLPGFGQAVKVPSKTNPQATLTLNQEITTSGKLPNPMVLNFKKTPQTLEDYQNMPTNRDLTTAIKNLDCTNIKSGSLSPTIPYGPQPAPAPGIQKQINNTEADLIQPDDGFEETENPPQTS